MVDYAIEDQGGRSRRALVVGPEEWGWSGYFYSGYDQQYGRPHGWSSLPDRNNHGGADYLPWLLGQLRQSSTTAGQRLLDVFTRPLLSAGRRVQRRRVDGDAAAAQSIDALAVGSELRRRDLDQRPRAADSAPEELGRRRPIRARRSASPNTTGAPRATSTARPRRPTSSASSAARASTWPRAGRRRTRHADVQGDEDVSQLRRQQVDVRRHQCRGRRLPNPDNVSAFAARALGRRRADGHGDQQAALDERRRRRSTCPPSPTAASRRSGS